MIIKKKKAVVAALLSAAMTVSAVVPAVSAAGSRTKPEKYGDSTYATRFLSLYDDVITNGGTNGYLSDENAPSGGFGVPYHCVETLNIEAPDYGHETTSEAMSYIVWMAAMRDNLGKKAAAGEIKDKDGSAIAATNDGDLAKAWKTMEVMIPAVQTGFMGHSDLSAQYSQEHDTPEEYPTPQDSNNTGRNPLAATFSSTYGRDNGLYLMHWLADVDDWYGYGSDTSYSHGKLVFINTFQRGAQESCWETIPHACVETLKFGGTGNQAGVKAVFAAQGQAPPQSWSYTNAPDAEDRAIQGVYAASRWGVANSDVLSKAGKMGDQLRNNMFDKYYKTIGTQNENTPQDMNNPYSGAHYLMSWYTSWGGAMDGKWAWQIGASHCHEFYQNPLAAYALLADDGLRNGMQSGSQAVTDYKKSLQTQLEFYLWLQSEQGPIAGGATSSWHGRYLPYKYLADNTAGVDCDAEYIKKYGTDVPTEFNKMAYQEHPVYADPGSNHWIGNQVWAIQRLAELYYTIKTNPTDVSREIKAGGLSMEDALAKILDRWVKWFVANTEIPEGSNEFSIPASLNWKGQPKTWSGAYDEHTGVECEITAYGDSDLGCVSSLANTLIYYAKANNVATEKAYTSKNTDVPSKALHLAHELLDREWATARDDIGLSKTEHNGSMWRLFEQPVWVPTWYNGKMPNGDAIVNGATFISLRSQYLKDAKVQEFKTVYDQAKAAGYEGGSEGMTAALETVDLNYHRFWHAGDILLALGTMAELYPDLEVDKRSDEDVPETLKVEKDSLTVEVGKTDKIKPNLTDVTYESGDTGVATVDADGTVTGVSEGSTTVTVTSADGQTVTVTVNVTPETSIPTGSLDPNKDYLYGDVNLNGIAGESADAVMLAKFIANPKVYDLFPNDAEKKNTSLIQSDVAEKFDGKPVASDLIRLLECVIDSIKPSDLGPKA